MNVLKKDIFSKTGAKSKRKFVDFSAMTSGPNPNPLPFLVQQMNENIDLSLSQSSISSSVASSSCSYFGKPEQQQQRNNDFELFMQPFIDEVQSQRENNLRFNVSLPEDDPGSQVFKKPRPVGVKSDSSGPRNTDRSHTTSEVLKILEQSSSQSIADFSLRPPLHQLEQDQRIFSQKVVGNEISPVSSIRPETTRTSSSAKKATNTTKSSTTLMDSDDHCIIAVTEGRGHASGEVGIAAMDPRRPHLILCQISDSQRYSHSLSKMNVFHCKEAIVPNTFVEGPTPRKLYIDLLDRFPSITVNHVQRRHFSEAVGLQMIQQYSSKESESVMTVVKDKFYALAAAAALLKYIEFTQNVLIAPRSLKVEYQGTDGTTIIDLDTASRLELVMGLVSREETHSLLGVLKHCRTKGGARLLRANLLQPMADAGKTNSRLDCVTELIENPILFNALESVISQMKNAENLLALCMHAPQQSGLKSAQFQLKYTLLLKSTLELVPSLINALHGANSDYFNHVRDNLQDTRLATILKRVLQTVVEGTTGNRKGTFNQLHACFMIRAGINGLLDVAKKTYCEIAQESADLVNALKTKYNLPLRLGFTQGKGYHIQMSPLDRLQSENLPDEFILVEKSRNSLTCYTAELVSLDQRCQQALHEIELMTNVLLFELLTDIREEISCLFPLCECLAELDVCIAFAHIGASEGYVRPRFDDELRLVAARHPILDVTAKERVVANDVFADTDSNFLIMTGPNQSGKSIYIRQVALLQVMAQIGCYVPAKEASFRIADRIFSRIGFDDNIESNSSTLMVEMQDMEFIRKNLTKNSLVIIDELCRGTSVEEGTCLAFALCEELLDTPAFVFFTTHFLFLTKLQYMYCNVRNFYFETELTTDGRPGLKFTHKMLEGVTPAERYGIRLAEIMGFPGSILDVAQNAAEGLLAERRPESKVCALTARYNIAKALRMSLPQENATWDDFLAVILEYKAEYEKFPPEDEDILSILEKEIADCERIADQSKSDSHTPVESAMTGEPERGPNPGSVTPMKDNSESLAEEPERGPNPGTDAPMKDTSESFAEEEAMEVDTSESSVHEVLAENEIDSNLHDSSERMVDENSEPKSECSNENSQQRCAAALVLLSRQRGVSIQMDEPKKKQKKREPKQAVDEFIRGMSAHLGHVSDKSQYYEWKYSRNKKELKVIAGASRGTPVAQFDAVKIPRAQSLTPSLRKTPKTQKPVTVKYHT